MCTKHLHCKRVLSVSLAYIFNSLVAFVWWKFWPFSLVFEMGAEVPPPPTLPEEVCRPLLSDSQWSRRTNQKLASNKEGIIGSHNWGSRCGALRATIEDLDVGHSGGPHIGQLLSQGQNGSGKPEFHPCTWHRGDLKPGFSMGWQRTVLPGKEDWGVHFRPAWPELSNGKKIWTYSES